MKANFRKRHFTLRNIFDINYNWRLQKRDLTCVQRDGGSLFVVFPPLRWLAISALNSELVDGYFKIINRYSTAREVARFMALSRSSEKKTLLAQNNFLT